MSASSSVVKANKMPAKKSDAKPVVVAAPPAPVAAAAPKAPKEAKAVKEPKAKAVKVEKAPASSASVTLPTVEAPSAPAVAEPTESSEVQLAALGEKLKALGAELQTKIRDAVKGVQDAIKTAKREARDGKKKKRKDPKDMSPEELKVYEARRANNAFLVQRPLTDELAAFMGLKSGEKRSQTEVTKFISGYVKQHNCFDPNFKRRILPNAALAKLLRVSDKDEVTYLNLQSFLKVHFKKAEVKA
jgi:chromatin remodeling complex protein RSC6